MAASFVGGGTDGSLWSDNANWSGTAPLPNSSVSTLYFKNGTTTAAIYSSTQGTTTETFDFHVGDLAGGDGSLTMTGGILNVNNTWGIIIGQQSTGIMTIDGGSFNQINDKPFRIRNSTAGNGTINLLSGSLTSASTDVQLNTNGQFNIVDGTASFASVFAAATGGLDFTSTGTGSLTMVGADLAYYQGLFNGDVLTIDGVDKTGGAVFASSFNVSGTTLSVIPESSTYALLAGLTGLTFVMVRRRR